MKYQETDYQKKKDKSSYEDTERILTREEGTELCRYMEQKAEEYGEYMRMMEAKKKAEQEQE